MIWRSVGVALFSITMLTAPQVRDNAKPETTGTAQISGSVTIADQPPVPARRATVLVAGEISGVRLTAVTDETGAFGFTSLPADRYTVSATKDGYLSVVFGSKRPGGSGTPVVLAAAGRATAAMTMVRGGVLSGTVRDESGRPMPNVLVNALHFAFSSSTGSQALQGVQIGSSGYVPEGYSGDSFPGSAVTDDRGEYRIWGLAAGQYIVSVQVRLPSLGPIVTTAVHQISAADVERAQQLLRSSAGGASVGSAQVGGSSSDATRVDYAPVFYPAATASADATPIALSQSEERSGLDVVVRLMPTASVGGMVTALDGTPLGGAQISLWDPIADRAVRATRTDEDGAFVLRGINPGRYQVQGFQLAEGLSGFIEMPVGGRDITTSLTLAPGVRISGRVVFDGTTPAPSLPAGVLLFLRRQPYLIGGSAFEMTPDGRFTYSRVPPGNYELAINGRPPAGWILRSVTMNGVDISDRSFEVVRDANIENVVVTLTDRRAEISGKLQDASGKPAPEYVLIVYSADSRNWAPRSRRTQYVRPDINGTFIARDLPAGDYFISAVTDVEDGQWNDREFLAALAASSPVKVTLAEGEKKTQNIQIGGSPLRHLLECFQAVSTIFAP